MQTATNSQWLPQSIRADLVDPANAQQFERGQTVLRNALRRSATDHDFRVLLKQDPTTAVQQEYQRTYNEPAPTGFASFEMHFVEPQGDFTVVLPTAVDSERELSDEELTSVNGGSIAGAVAAAAVVSNLACVGFAAGVATVAIIAWAIS
jgi:hypothetical protein